MSPYDIIQHAGPLSHSATCRNVNLPAAKWVRKPKVDLRIAVFNPSWYIFHVYKLLPFDLVHLVLKVIPLAA